MEQPATSPGRVVLKVAQKTDPGLDPDKQVNEDSCATGEVPLGHLLVVCDGMGGHMSGREASMRAVQTIFGDMERWTQGSPGEALKRSIEHAGQLVYDLGGQGPNPLRPGSTCVALLVHPAGTEVAHVGDSRAYVIREAQIYPLTKDHSMVQQMIDAGVLTEEEAVGHPDANKITRALGMRATAEVESRPTPMVHVQGDIFVLASDGLCDLAMPPEILAVLLKAREARGLEFACEQLIALANTRGGHDNITVVVAEIVDAPPIAQLQQTVVGTPSQEAQEPLRTLPDLPVLPAALEAQPTMIDAPSLGAEAPGSDSRPAPTWIGGEPEGEEAPSEAVRSRQVLWIGLGAGLLLAGIALVVLSIWWVLMRTSWVPPSGGTIDEQLTATSGAVINCTGET